MNTVFLFSPVACDRRLLATRLAIRPIIAVLLMLFSGVVGVVHGQTPRGVSLLDRYAPVQIKPGVFSGRIVGRHLRQGRPQVLNRGGEQFSVQPVGTAGNMELVYDGRLREGPFRGEKLTVLLDTAGRLEIERGAGDKSRKNGEKTPSDVYMRFVQRPGEPISFAWGDRPNGDGPNGDGANHRVVQASSIWELLIGYPQACRRHLLPILYKLRPGWNLLLEAERVKSELLRMADEGPTAKDTQWQKLVEQLGDDGYSRREAADRQLRAAGRHAVGFLRKLDKSQLDAEQRFRVARIVREFADIEPTPRQIAEESRRDPAIWLALARSGEEPVRRTARAELQSLLKRPIRFDPSADSATRNAQLGEIGKLIERKF